jgi:hypothetical protein
LGGDREGLSFEDLDVPRAAAHRTNDAAGRLPDILILRVDRILPDEERPMIWAELYVVRIEKGELVDVSTNFAEDDVSERLSCM